MKRLTNLQIAELNRFLAAANAGKALLPELLDHLSCEAEARIWEGQSFDEVLVALRGEVTGELLQDLNLTHQNLLAMNSSLDEIVFEGRNKAYGAYALRSHYAVNVQKALFLAVLVFAALVFLPKYLASLKPKSQDLLGPEVDLTMADFTKEEPEAKVVPPPVETVKPVQKEIRYLPPVVKTDVPEETPPPTIEALQDAHISSKNVEGEIFTEDVILPPAEHVGPAKGDVVEAKPEEEKEWVAVEQQPMFEGGDEAFRKFLTKHLRYPAQASRANVQGKVFLQFVVMPDGSLDQVEVIKGIGFGCDEEAVRVLKLMPKWRPGKQAGKAVRVRFTLPIQFALSE